MSFLIETLCSPFGRRKNRQRPRMAVSHGESISPVSHRLGIFIGVGLAAIVIGAGLNWQKSSPTVAVESGAVDVELHEIESDLDERLKSRLTPDQSQEIQASHEPIDLVRGLSDAESMEGAGPALYTASSDRRFMRPELDQIDDVMKLKSSIRAEKRQLGAKLIGVIEEIPEGDLLLETTSETRQALRSAAHVELPSPAITEEQPHEIKVVPGEYLR